MFNVSLRTFSKNQKWVVPIHLCFWLIFIALMFIVYGTFITSVTKVVIIVVVNVIGHIILVYTNLLYLIPKYFVAKRFKAYAIALLALLLGTTLLRYGASVPILSGLERGEELFFRPNIIGGFIISGLFLIIFSIPLILIDQYSIKEQLEMDLKTQQLQAELKFLKAQVNPHFLFNALNNIYSLSFTKSDQAPDMILKLSDMMSYMLYDCKAPFVPLSNEIAYLDNYIALQQLKKDGDQNIEFRYSDIGNTMVTPMLFIPFFENAFKHGNIEDTAKGWIESQISVANGRLHFFIKNSISKNTDIDQPGGIGLANIKERLKHLYPDKFELSIMNNPDSFEVDLMIDLS